MADRTSPGSLPFAALAVLVASALAAAAPPESPGPHPDAGEQDPVAVPYIQTERVRLVLLPANVIDRKGRAVPGLERDDFSVFENMVPQEIEHFSSGATEPLSVAFLLDVSGSMRHLDKLMHAKEAIRHFVDRLHPGDRFALICFADSQVDWITEFTDDRERFLERLEVQRGFGRTALNDAVAAAPHLVSSSVKGRKAIVLITDGLDTSSQLPIWKAVRLAREVNVPVYALGFMSIPERSHNEDKVEIDLRVLRRVATETGGRLFAIHDVQGLKEAVATMDSELRHQYLIGYYPRAGLADRSFRRILVTVDKRRLEVRTRKGYFATP